MNKEIEDDKQYLKDVVSLAKAIPEIKIPDEEIEAITGILQYIVQLENKVKELENNSIPKHIVEEKIKELEHTPRREFCYYDDFTASQIYILKQILEE